MLGQIKHYQNLFHLLYFFSVAIRNTSPVIDVLAGQCWLAANCRVENPDHRECIRVRSICQEIRSLRFCLVFIRSFALS